MTDILWTPWRLDFILGAKQPGCVLCQKIHAQPDQDRENLVLYRGQHCAAILNLYPYSTGHLMVLPYLHTSDFAGLEAATLGELADLTRRSVALLKKTHRPDGLNLGMNLGKVAGAGIDDHLHQHIVPRWNGDNNFMSVTGQTRLMPELLLDTYDKLKAALAEFFEVSASAPRVIEFERQLTSDPTATRRQLEEDLLSLNEVSEPAARARWLGRVGNDYRMLGRYPEAIKRLEEAVQLAHQTEHPDLETVNLIRLATAIQYSGQLGQAETLFRQALELSQQHGLAAYEDFALQHLAKCLVEEGQLNEAISCFERALELRQAKGDPELTASTEQSLAAARKLVQL